MLASAVIVHVTAAALALDTILDQKLVGVGVLVPSARESIRLEVLSVPSVRGIQPVLGGSEHLVLHLLPTTENQIYPHFSVVGFVQTAGNPVVDVVPLVP